MWMASAEGSLGSDVALLGGILWTMVLHVNLQMRS